MKSAAITLSILIATTIAIAAFGLDLTLASLFYTPGSGFTFGGRQPWSALYEFGEWPGLILAMGALVVLLLGIFEQKLQRFRLASLFLLLLYVIGPGLVVNVALKEFWGRPRPADIFSFGGTRTFHQPWQIRTMDRRKSFPSGHASVAFYLFAPYFLLRSTRKRAAYACLSVGTSYGILVGFARITQGAHFLSDILWSGGIVYLAGLLLAHGMGITDRNIKKNEPDFQFSGNMSRMPPVQEI